MQKKASIYWHRWTTIAALLLAWMVLAAWQWQEFETERETERESLRRQAESVAKALIGGMRSHRHLGRFVEEQLQSVLDELAASRDVLAVAVVSSNERLSLSAGDTDLLDISPPIETGSIWEKNGFRYVESFRALPEAPMPGLRQGPAGRQNPRGRARPRYGPMAGNENRPADERPPPDSEPPPEEHDWRPRPRENMGSRPRSMQMFALLLLDRGRADRQIFHYAWVRLLVVIAGGAVILSVVFVWRATVRLTEARGRAQLLEIEARHLRDLSRAATGLAHETRNPLGLIRGWTQRWMRSMADDADRGQAQAVIEECDRVTARINQFLAFARPCEPKLTAVRPDKIVAELAALVEPDLDAKKLKLNAEYSPPDVSIRADREMLRQALFNIIQNAVEFSPEGSVIDVFCRDGEDGAARIEVADRGPGVPPETVDLLFTPYHTTRPNGTGLGLAIVSRIAVVHGWRSGYSPRSGGGAVFWIEWQR